MESPGRDAVIVFPELLLPSFFLLEIKKKAVLYQYLMIAIIFNWRKCLPLHKVEGQHLSSPCIEILVPLYPLGRKML